MRDGGGGSDVLHKAYGCACVCSMVLGGGTCVMMLCWMIEIKEMAVEREWDGRL